MKIRYLKFKNWLLTLAAAALGINCTECAVEYGTPEATYHVKGTVSDPDGKPIPGIEVNHYGHPYDTTDHNQDGYGVYPAERFLYNFTFYNFFSEESGELNDMCFLVAVPEEK